MAKEAATPTAGDLVRGALLEARSAQQPYISRGREDYIWGTPSAALGSLLAFLVWVGEEIQSSESLSPTIRPALGVVLQLGLAGQ